MIGNELLTSTAQGRSYGAELLLKWLIAKKLNLASSFTLFKSEYRNNKESEYIASAWDNRFIFNLRGTYNLPPTLERRDESQLHRRCSLHSL